MLDAQALAALVDSVLERALPITVGPYALATRPAAPVPEELAAIPWTIAGCVRAYEKTATATLSFRGLILEPWRVADPRYEADISVPLIDRSINADAARVTTFIEAVCEAWRRIFEAHAQYPARHSIWLGPEVFQNDIAFAKALGRKSAKTREALVTELLKPCGLSTNVGTKKAPTSLGGYLLPPPEWAGSIIAVLDRLLSDSPVLLRARRVTIAAVPQESGGYAFHGLDGVALVVRVTDDSSIREQEITIAELALPLSLEQLTAMLDGWKRAAERLLAAHTAFDAFEGWFPQDFFPAKVIGGKPRGSADEWETAFAKTWKL